MNFDTQPLHPGSGSWPLDNNIVVTSFTAPKPVGIDAQVAAAAGFFRIAEPPHDSLAQPVEARLLVSLPVEPRPDRFNLKAISLEQATLKILRVETGRFRLIEG
jgi:hypothetical protein